MTHTPELSANEVQTSSPPLLGLSALLRAAFQDEDLTVHVPALMARAESAGDAYAMLDLALILQLRFQKESGLAVLGEALKIRQLFRIASGDENALHLLVIKTAGDLMANTPLECLLDDAGITIDVLYVGPELPWPERLPPHDLVFVAISEADAHRALLDRLATYLQHWPRPVLNLPQRIPRLSRDRAFEVLRDVPGICMTTTSRIDRQALQQLAHEGSIDQPVMPGIRFPVILRPLGSHAGTDLCRIDGAQDIAAYLQGVEAAQFFVANFIDYASADGLFRKLRVVQIDGRAFVCHMGISGHWMVHYPYEEMKADAGRRQEEAAMMANFDDDFAIRHRDALAAIHARFGLDYVGFDCAQTRDGRLLIFEMANALVIHAIDDPEVFPYKTAQMHKVFAAFLDMLQRKALPRT
ncbi:MAG: hypothetical protein KGJ32_00520 [Xanthomonadaceae bacterium]|nr:hypothetical protein [Xanthomonadaceae bacterium]